MSRALSFTAVLVGIAAAASNIGAAQDGESSTRARLAPAAPELDRRSLKEAVGDRFQIGVGVSHQVVEQPEDAELIRQHFQILTPENCMKPQSIHPAKDRWNYEAADRFAAFARANRLEVVGYCLVWAKDDRTDEWMKQENGRPVSSETLLHRIEAHVKTVVERYADVATQ
jgi:GH35 family endo-1,4-beta-xylanase